LPLDRSQPAVVVEVELRDKAEGRRFLTLDSAPFIIELERGGIATRIGNTDDITYVIVSVLCCYAT
jgi:hypothetical protein